MPIAPSTVVTTITQDKILPNLVDTTKSGNVLMLRLFGQQKPWPSGETLRFPVKVRSSTALGSYAGFDVFGTAQTDQRVLASTNASQYYASITVSGIQRALNVGDAKVLDLIATEAQGIALDLRDNFGDDVYGDGTGNSSKVLLGLVAAVDDTTSVTTYLNISRSTFTAWRGTRTAQSGSLSLANLAADVDAAQVGNEVPTLGICPPAVFTIYEALLTPTVSHQYSANDYRLTAAGFQKLGADVLARNSSTPAAGNGFRALTFRGIPIAADEKCTSGNLYFLNENHFSFYSVKT